VVTYERLTTKENFKLLVLKVVSVAYKRWSLRNFWYSGKLVAEERWSLTRGGRNWRFDCNYFENVNW